MTLVTKDDLKLYFSEPSESWQFVMELPGCRKSTQGRFEAPLTMHMAIRLVQISRMYPDLEFNEEFLDWLDAWLARWKFRNKRNDDNIPETRMEPWDHQRKAYWFATRMPAALISVPMGGGKTKITHDIITNTGDFHDIIICPKRVIDVWPEEFAKHQTAITPPILPLLKGTAAQKAKEAEEFLNNNERGVIVVNFETAMQTAFFQWARARIWDRMIVDEVHRLKAAGSTVSNWMFLLGQRAYYRLGLSGTIMADKPIDMYGVFRWADCAIFGTNYDKFDRMYVDRNPYNTFKIDGYVNQEQMMKKYYSITYEVPESVLNLPKPTEVKVYTELSASMKKMYNAMDKKNVIDNEYGLFLADNTLVRDTRLQQITSGFINNTDEPEVFLHDDKAKALAETMGELEGPVVVFAKFKHDLTQIRDVMDSIGVTWSELSGNMNGLKDWQHGKTEALIVQIQSGSEGVDFTRARYGIYYSLGTSLKDYLQSRKRLDRPGQKHNVTFIHILCKDTIDTHIYAALELKEDVIEYLKRLRGIEP